MADAPETKNSLFKTLVTSALGIIGGAVAMWLTSFVSSAIKPPKPLPNFAFQVEGLHVTFMNRSTHAQYGWWDFGDNTALEPFTPDKDRVVHQFPKPGTYNVKLALKNILGEESERTVTVALNEDTMPKPDIRQFRVKALSDANKTPVTYEISAELRNVDMCIWSLGDEVPMEVVNDPGKSIRKTVTFDEPGFKTLRLFVPYGKKPVERSETIFVTANTFQSSPSTPAAPSATIALNLTYVAAPDSKTETWTYVVPLPSGSGAVVPFETRPQSALPGFTIAKYEILPNKQIKDGLPLLSADRTGLSYRGEVFRPAFNVKSITIQARVWLEKPGQLQEVKRDPVYMTLKIPGETILPLPALESGWIAKGIKMDLKIHDERNQSLFATQKDLPTNARIVVGGRDAYLTVSRTTDHLKFVVQQNLVGSGN